MEHNSHNTEDEPLLHIFVIYVGCVEEVIVAPCIMPIYCLMLDYHSLFSLKLDLQAFLLELKTHSDLK